MESTQRTDLLKWLIGGRSGYPLGHHQGKISGLIDIEDSREETPLRRIEFSDAYIYDFCEQMDSDSPLPMTQLIAISPLRLDINRTVRMDRRWPQTPGHWKKYVPEEEPAAAAEAQEETPPECTVTFRRTKDYDGSFGFDWLRVGDTNEVGCEWYKNSMVSVGDYDRFVDQYANPFVQEWRKQCDEYRDTAKYIVPWVTLMKVVRQGCVSKCRCIIHRASCRSELRAWERINCRQI